MEILYILGSTRSGTSALRNALNLSRFKGYGEGHAVGLLEGWIASVETARAQNPQADKAGGNAIARLREHRLIRHLFHAYEQYLSGELNSKSLMDKTPTITPITLAPKLNQFHHNPLFLHCGRRHIDNIVSKLRKFPETSFESHCREWTDCRLAWLEARAALDGNFLDLDFHDLVTDNAGSVARIGDYLELSGEDRDRVLAYLRSERPESSGKSEIGRAISLDETGWSEEDKAIFLRICGEAGETLGYGLDSYFA